MRQDRGCVLDGIIPVYSVSSGDSGKNLRTADECGNFASARIGTVTVLLHVVNAEESLQDHEETSSDRRDGPIGL